jgi:hypothetical protein
VTFAFSVFFECILHCDCLVHQELAVHTFHSCIRRLKIGVGDETIAFRKSVTRVSGNLYND